MGFYLRDLTRSRLRPAALRAADSGSPAVFPITLTEGTVIELAVRLAERGVEVRSLMGGIVTKQPAFAHLHHDELVWQRP